MVSFNIPPFLGTEIDFVKEAIDANRKICGDGPFTAKCHAWIEERFGVQKALLTTSGSAALEMAALLCGIKEGDEVILPSYTFSSTANAFVSVGARLVFVDIRSDTMNIDEQKIEAAITKKTKAICVVHYAGVSCEMDKIMAIASAYDLKVVEDAAQGVMAEYKGRPLGTIGDFGCYSFHETKNYSMGEGGALLINDQRYNEDAEVIREKGTNRSQFFRGQVAKYNWVGYGSSYLPSDINAAYLWGQLLDADKINEDRLATWEAYREAFDGLEKDGYVRLPMVPSYCRHNAHMFYLVLDSLETRTQFISFMKDRGIACSFHYVPLHSSPAGLEYGSFSGEDINTTDLSDRLVRLPLYYGLSVADREDIIAAVLEFFGSA